MNQLQNILLQLENHIPNLEKSNSKISSSSIGWQIDHCLLVINGIVNQLEVSNPSDYRPKFNLPKFIVFTTGKIPRGKARAPKIVMPVDVATADELKSKIELAKTNILKLNSFPTNAHFKHPFFGDINASKTEKFLAIHTKHHLKIIEDILK
jgi:hypothetical protein